MQGIVINRAGLDLPHAHFGSLVIGGGLLGLATAFYLRRLQPDASLLLVEAGGIPSEDGASFVSPAIVGTLPDAAELRLRALWSRQVLAGLSAETGVTRPHDTPFRQVGHLSLSAEVSKGCEATEQVLERLPREQRVGLTELLTLATFPYAHWDERAGYGSAEAATLHYGFGAVAAGATLMLNARAAPLSATEVELERLEFNRRMERVVVRRERVSADRVIVAAGAATGPLVEEGLGRLLATETAYHQYLRVEKDRRLPTLSGQVTLPVVRAAGFTLRPQGEGLLVVPPRPAPDPDGYVPKGARMMGVRVGVRRELLETLLQASDNLPLLNWHSLNLGKTVEGVRGAWEVLTPGGLPVWSDVGEDWSIILGGEQGFALGPATAYDLAATLAEVKSRPWAKGRA